MPGPRRIFIAVQLLSAVLVPTLIGFAQDDSLPKNPVIEIDFVDDKIKGHTEPSDGVPRIRLADGSFGIPVKVTVPGKQPAPAPSKADEPAYSLTAVLAYYGDGKKQALTVTTNAVAPDQTVTVPAAFANKELELSVIATYGDSAPKQFDRESPIARVIIDTAPPELARTAIEVDRFPGGGGTLRVNFKDGDLDGETVSDAFTIVQKVTTDDAKTTPKDVTVVPEGLPHYVPGSTYVELTFSNLNPGNYELTIADNVIKDTVGNDMAAPATPVKFSVAKGRQHGTQVEYPRLLSPGGKHNEISKFQNPGDRIDTRDVRLYYFRDAHRVAEIINRNVRSLNQTGYDHAQRAAAKARDDADALTDKRRRQETLAVQAAQSTRSTRATMEKAQQRAEDAAAKLDQLEPRKALIQEEISEITTADGIAITGTTARPAYNAKILELHGTLQTKKSELNAVVSTDPKFKPLQEEINKLETQIVNLGESRKRIVSLELVRDQEEKAIQRLKEDYATASKAAVDQQSKLTSDQQSEIVHRNRILDGEAAELRGRQRQFRQEVAAGLTDRDTYVAGKLDSIDPVTQVSIAVIGEGVLQLRGPMTGINKIRRMVHQIDSPVGQVKIAIHTIQINGEHGDRMEKVYEDIDKHVARSRFLTNQSGLMFRKAVGRVASQVATSVDGGYIPDGCEAAYQAGFEGAATRDMKYMYAFFGKDFVDELREMDSELLQSNNKMMSLNSMDTISLPGALNVTALANNTVRQQIVAEFQNLIMTEFLETEIAYYRTLTRTRFRHNILNKLTGPKTQTRLDERDAKRLAFNACRSYHFSNTVGFFDSQLQGEGTLNNVQYATLKLAQTLKAQLITEMELQNLVQQRSLLETEPNEIEDAYLKSRQELKAQREELESEQNRLAKRADTFIVEFIEKFGQAVKQLRDQLTATLETSRANRTKFIKERNEATSVAAKDVKQKAIDNVTEIITVIETWDKAWEKAILQLRIAQARGHFAKVLYPAVLAYKDQTGVAFGKGIFLALADAFGFSEPRGKNNNYVYKWINTKRDDLRVAAERWETNRISLLEVQRQSDGLEEAMKLKRKDLFSKRLLDQFIDEQEEKAVELLEALRSHSSNVDNYLKRLAIGLEDDVNAQFYDPAFQKIRRVSRTYDVQLGAIEKTTILTNNRTFAKVSPAATMEFDLPKRDILITEAMKGSKALAQEYGHLMKDGTFLAGSSLLSGQPAGGLVNSASPTQQIPGLSTGESNQFGAALEGLIPDPSVYKFETGTGYEIRPVIQPDGHSIVYNFNYMYTTNVREPVRADEKHLGRVKRHFVHTDVQTSSYELREVSRYSIALKASRTSRGVPLLEDVPGVGALFRPMASAESSIQQNIILASSVIYPTMYDLMGLRWSSYVDKLDSHNLVQQKSIQNSRREQIRLHLLEQTRESVDKAIGIPARALPEDITPGPALPARYPRTAPPQLGSDSVSPYLPPNYREPIALPAPPGVSSWNPPRGNRSSPVARPIRAVSFRRSEPSEIQHTHVPSSRPVSNRKPRFLSSVLSRLRSSDSKWDSATRAPDATRRTR